MRYAFFPGCVLKGFAAEAYDATMEVGVRLGGMELIEIPGWSCCGLQMYRMTMRPRPLS